MAQEAIAAMTKALERAKVNYDTTKPRSWDYKEGDQPERSLTIQEAVSETVWPIQSSRTCWKLCLSTWAPQQLATHSPGVQWGTCDTLPEALHSWVNGDPHHLHLTSWEKNLNMKSRKFWTRGSVRLDKKLLLSF